MDQNAEMVGVLKREETTVKCEVFGCHSAHASPHGDHALCERHADAMLFMDLAIGDTFTVEEPYGSNLFGVWRKLKGSKNPAYPSLTVNAERVKKTGRSFFAEGDLDWTWMNANFRVQRA